MVGSSFGRCCLGRSNSANLYTARTSLRRCCLGRSRSANSFISRSVHVRFSLGWRSNARASPASLSFVHSSISHPLWRSSFVFLSPKVLSILGLSRPRFVTAVAGPDRTRSAFATRPGDGLLALRYPVVRPIGSPPFFNFPSIKLKEKGGSLGSIFGSGDGVGWYVRPVRSYEGVFIWLLRCLVVGLMGLWVSAVPTAASADTGGVEGEAGVSFALSGNSASALRILPASFCASGSTFLDSWPLFCAFGFSSGWKAAFCGAFLFLKTAPAVGRLTGITSFREAFLGIAILGGVAPGTASSISSNSSDHLISLIVTLLALLAGAGRSSPSLSSVVGHGLFFFNLPGGAFPPAARVQPSFFPSAAAFLLVSGGRFSFSAAPRMSSARADLLLPRTPEARSKMCCRGSSEVAKYPFSAEVSLVRAGGGGSVLKSKFSASVASRTSGCLQGLYGTRSLGVSVRPFCNGDEMSVKPSEMGMWNEGRGTDASEGFQGQELSERAWPG